MTSKNKIFSPMASGNGAYIVHSILEKKIPGYSLEAIPVRKTVYPSLLKSYRKDASIVHTVPEYGDIFFSSKSKSVITFHNFFWDAQYRPFCSLSQRLYYQFLQAGFVKRAVDKADVIVAVSEYTASLVRGAFPSVEVQVILNGVDVNRFTPVKKCRGKALNILFSGNPTRRKGRHVLKAVADSLPEHAKLLVTGGLRKDNTDLCHPRIRFIGHVPYKNMPKLYRDSDILILPSYREGLSLSALEAMASGLPVVAYDASSMSELIISNQGGYLTPSDDIAGLNNSIAKLIADPVILAEMGAFNRQRTLALFDQQRMVSEYVELFDSM
jgi:glycosyltransferase involved in cell wall biosynthesis